MSNTKKGKGLLIGKIGVVLLLLLTLQVSAFAAGERMLIPLGETAGIRMCADGVLVVGMSQVPTLEGEVSPAARAGLQAGDRIISINGKTVDSIDTLKTLVSAGGTLETVIEREGERLTYTVMPVKSEEDGASKLGAWVRDSLAGIGTLTFFEPKTGLFGALGHGVTDTDTKTLMPLASGRLVRSQVESVRRGEAGNPGELQGSFDTSDEYGELLCNSSCGVFGSVGAAELHRASIALPAASPEEIEPGEAVILCSVSGDQVEQYAVRILQINRTDPQRNLLLKVTDERLLEATGGIVQGMSGSPILQNGKIVGAVTHVLVKDPTRGYGIYIGNMLAEADKILERTA